MAVDFQLYAPGTRNRNKFWVARGRVAGERKEISTGRLTQAEAEIEAAAIFANLRRQLEPAPRRGVPAIPSTGSKITFGQAAEAYAQSRRLDLVSPRNAREREEAKRINSLIAELGLDPVANITQARLGAAAVEIMGRPIGNCHPATLNREIRAPAAAILHYAAEQDWCEYRRVRRWQEPPPRTRAVSQDIAQTLIEAVPPGPKKLMLLWLFLVGSRISDTCQVQWPDGPDEADNVGINLDTATVRMRIGKLRGEVKEFDLDPMLIAALSGIPSEQRHGRLFPWLQKTGVYKWLRPLTRELGIKFTPHMARHSLGTWLNRAGAPQRTIMAVLGQNTLAASVRYQTAELQTMREARTRATAGLFSEDRGRG